MDQEKDAVIDRSDRFSFQPEAFPQCLFCRHLGSGDLPVCAAFPAQIPEEILNNEWDHRIPWIDPDTGKPGDEGVPLAGSITFAPRENVPAEVLAALHGHLDRHSA